MGKIITYNEAFQISLNRDRKTIIFKSGCFDILHVGHVIMLQNAKSYADILMVGVGGNETVKKDRQFTYFDEDNRALLVASLLCVDYVIILKEEAIGNIDHANFLKTSMPNYFYVAIDDKQIEGKKELASKLGIRIIYHDSMKVSNHGEIIEPHATQLKELWK